MWGCKQVLWYRGICLCIALRMMSPIYTCTRCKHLGWHHLCNQKWLQWELWSNCICRKQADERVQLDSFRRRPWTWIHEWQLYRWGRASFPGQGGSWEWGLPGMGVSSSCRRNEAKSENLLTIAAIHSNVVWPQSMRWRELECDQNEAEWSVFWPCYQWRAQWIKE